jgi:hypothetical protein
MSCHIRTPLFTLLMLVDEFLNTLQDGVNRHHNLLLSKTVHKWVMRASHSHMMNTTLYSRNMQVNDLVANMAIAQMAMADPASLTKKEFHEEEVVHNNTKHTLRYAYNRHFLEYALYERKGVDKVLLCKFCNDRLSAASIIPNTKHVVKFVIYDKLSKSMCMTLKTIIEKHTDTTIFLVMCSSLTCLDSVLLGQMEVLSCRLLTHHVFNEQMQNILRISETCDFSGLPCEHFIQTSIVEATKTDKSSSHIFETVHALTLKLMNSIIPFHMVCRIMLKLIDTTVPSKTVEYLDYITRIEHESHLVNKMCFAYDAIFLEAIRLLKTTDD